MTTNLLEKKFIDYLSLIAPTTLFIIYLASTPPGVTMEDSGLFILIAKHAGLAQPFGYPFVTLLGKIASELLPGTPAFVFHLMNCFLGSIAAFLFLNTCFNLKINELIAFSGTFYIFFSGSIWFQSIVAEVYVLTLVVFLAALNSGIKYYQNGRRQSAYILFFFIGLGLSTHPPLIIVSLPGLAFIGKKAWNEHNITKIKFLLFFALGLLPIIHLPLASFYSNYFFLSPISSLGDFLAYITRDHYRAMEHQSSPTPMLFAQSYFNQIWTELPFASFVLFPVGVGFFFRKLRAGLTLCLIWSSVCGLALLAFWKVDLNEHTEEMWRNWQLIPITSFGILLTAGLQTIYELLVKGRGNIARAFFTSILVGLVLFQLKTGWSRNDLRKDTFAADHAKIILEALPENAVLLVQDEHDIFPIAYVHDAEKIRPDIRLYSQSGIFFPNSIYSKRIEPNQVIRRTEILDFMTREKRKGNRIFATSILLDFKEFKPYPIPYQDYGLFIEMFPDLASETIPNTLIENSAQLLDRFSKGDFPKNWSYLRKSIITRYCKLLHLYSSYHPVMRMPRCMSTIAKELQLNRNYIEAEKLYLQALPHLGDLPIQELSITYSNFLANQIQLTIQSDQPGKQNNNRLAHAIKLATPVAERHLDCSNSLLRTILVISNSRRIPIPSEKVLTVARQCR